MQPLYGCAGVRMRQPDIVAGIGVQEPARGQLLAN